MKLIHKFITMKWKAVLPAISLLILSSYVVYAQPEKAESKIQAIMQDANVVGMSVAVVKHNKIIYIHSFGLKDLASKQPMTDDCIYRIASISKSFSATAIMQLVEAGKVSLDDDVSKLVGFSVRNPRFPETVITLRTLMQHRSSINDSQGYFSLDSINPATNPNWANCYNNYEPGKGYMYCNLNYNMTGTIIEKISGERFDLYIKHHILDPLKLYGGYCVDSLDKNRFATIYEYQKDAAKFVASPNAYHPRRDEIAHYVMGRSTPIFSPTGGMKISATDLAKYMIMHSRQGKYQGTRIISKKSASEMQAKVSEEDGYGMAIETQEKLIPGKIMKGHTGSAYGLYSGMFFQPKEKFGFVVISNGCGPAYESGFNALIKSTINALYESFIQ
jgi:CubicO group peptidase (beta-lactamase class C family)